MPIHSSLLKKPRLVEKLRSFHNYLKKNNGQVGTKTRGIDLNNVQIVEGNTFRWGGKYSDDYSTRETLFTELGVFETFSPLNSI